MNKKWIIALMGLAAAGIASAANISVTNDIATSTTWTADNEYFLEDVIYVLPGATLTIEPGTIIRGVDDADTPGPDNPGTLCVTVGAKIIANGTKDNPIIFTSVDDDLVTYVVETARWGNLTILGSGLISSDQNPSATGDCDGLATALMEGLTSPTLAIYGGANDDDDSGSLSYVSLRYHGFELTTQTELNGLSLGGVGRGTDMHHIDIFNNADDGIEIWGGTVNLKYVSIWNAGDDSFDLDQGWRGKAQFGLLVQGYCNPSGSQGSGVGDNLLEMDGAEPSTFQPYSAPKLYNFTVIGQNQISGSGDNATEWRDNMRAQIRNSIFMDIGDRLVADGGSGGGGGGYPAGDLLTNLFARAYNVYPATNSSWIASAEEIYPNFTDGTWCEISDSVFYNVRSWGIAAACGLFNASQNNVTNSALPIVAITRSATVGPLSMQNVSMLDPRAAGAAVQAVKPAPNDGFFTPVTYRGAFSPNYNWLEGWTAADAYGLTDVSMNGNDPAATIQLTASTFFQSEFGELYTVEESSNMVSWTPVATIEGDGSIMAVTDLDAFDSAKFYRVTIQ